MIIEFVLGGCLTFRKIITFLLEQRLAVDTQIDGPYNSNDFALIVKPGPARGWI